MANNLTGAAASFYGNLFRIAPPVRNARPVWPLWRGGRSPLSPAFVRAPEDNGCAERFIRTLKENPGSGPG